MSESFDHDARRFERLSQKWNKFRNSNERKIEKEGEPEGNGGSRVEKMPGSEREGETGEREMGCLVGIGPT